DTDEGIGTSTQGGRQRYYDPDEPREFKGRDTLTRDTAKERARNGGVNNLVDVMRESNKVKFKKYDEGGGTFREYLDIKRGTEERRIVETKLDTLRLLQRAAVKKLQNPILIRLGVPPHAYEDLVTISGC
ncbi:hypothetical protein MKX01_017123, partial [Papaver californicum]